MSYMRPVDPTWISSWRDHTRRNPPSQEAGTDYGCPVGTPIRAAGAGVIYATAGGIAPATGRYLTLDLDDGRRVRYLHLSRWASEPGQRVGRGQVIAYSGASGYGSEDAAGGPGTGGPHVHTTLWRHHEYRFGTDAGTLDFDYYAEQGTTAGGDFTPFPTEEDDMFSDEDRAELAQLRASVAQTRERVDALYAGFFGPANVGASQLSWYSVDQTDGLNDIKKASYGLLDINMHTQQLAAQAARDSATILAQVNEELGGEEDDPVTDDV